MQAGHTLNFDANFYRVVQCPELDRSEHTYEKPLTTKRESRAPIFLTLKTGLIITFECPVVVVVVVAADVALIKIAPFFSFFREFMVMRCV